MAAISKIDIVWDRVLNFYIESFKNLEFFLCSTDVFLVKIFLYLKKYCNLLAYFFRCWEMELAFRKNPTHLFHPKELVLSLDQIKDRIGRYSISVLYIYMNWLIGLVGRVCTNGPGELGSIPGRFIPKTLKMVLDTSLLNTQHYKVCTKGKVEQSRELSCALCYTLL